MSTKKSQDEGGTAYLCTSRRRDEDGPSALNNPDEVMETSRPETAGLSDIGLETLDMDGEDEENDDEEEGAEEEDDEEDAIETEEDGGDLTNIVTETDNDDREDDDEKDFNNNPSVLDNFEVASKNKELEVFTLFPDLPLELQMKIWNLALPQPRIVQLRIMAIPKSVIKPTVAPGSIQRKSHSNYIRANIPISSLLSVCKVSRQIMLETYTVGIPSKGDWRFYVDNEADWLLLNDPVLAGGLNGAVLGLKLSKRRAYENALRGVKRLVFPGKYILVRRNRISNLGNWLLSLLSSLEALIIYSDAAPNKKSWYHDNLCLSTDFEFWDQLGMGGSVIVRKDIRATDDKLKGLREKLIEVGGKSPVVTHMWLRWKH